MLFDVDGTLVDTNYLHTIAWWQALRAHGHVVEMARIHRAVGLGADKILDHLLGEERGHEDDEAATAAHDTLFGAWHQRLTPLPGAVDLVRRCAEAGFAVVLASSAGGGDLEALRRVLDCDDALSAVTSSEDAEHSKPDTDILEVALARVGGTPEQAIFVGDAVWDMQASTRMGLTSIGLECGGTSAAELREAGADEVWSTPANLLRHWSASALGRLGGA